MKDNLRIQCSPAALALQGSGVSLSSIPWIDDEWTALLEVLRVARGNSSPSRAGDSSDLGIELGNGLTFLFTPRGHFELDATEWREALPNDRG